MMAPQTQTPPSFDDIYPMIMRAWWQNPWHVAGIICLLFLMIASIVYLLRRSRRRVVVLTPDQRYFAMLEPFKDASFESAQEQRAFYSAVGIALREYLLATRNWDLMQATDDELATEVHRLLAHSTASEFVAIGALVEELTRDAQDVKFAGTRRDASQVREDYEKSITIPTLLAWPDRNL